MAQSKSDLAKQPLVFMLTRTREVIHADVSWDAVTAIQSRQVDTHRVGMTVVHLSCTLIDI